MILCILNFLRIWRHWPQIWLWQAVSFPLSDLVNFWKVIFNELWTFFVSCKRIYCLKCLSNIIWILGFVYYVNFTWFNHIFNQIRTDVGDSGFASTIFSYVHFTWYDSIIKHKWLFEIVQKSSNMWLWIHSFHCCKIKESIQIYYDILFLNYFENKK